MKFFEDPKNAGLAFIICALLSFISAIYSLAVGLTGDASGSAKAGFVIIAIGAVLGALIYYKFGKKMREGGFSGKMDILGNIVKTAGKYLVIVGLFMVVGGLLAGDAVGGLVDIIVGLVFVWVANKMLDGKATTIDKIVWILLLVFSVLGIIGSLLSIISIVGLITGICTLIIYLMVLLYTLDPEVKKQMGM